jgi:hypothetical protein
MVEVAETAAHEKITLVSRMTETVSQQNGTTVEA